MQLPEILTNVGNRISEIFSDVSRAVDRTYSIYVRRNRGFTKAPTYSWGRSDYEYWRRAYYCKVPGLELSGLFIRPIVNKIAAWTLGRPPSFQLKNKKSQSELENWWDSYHSQVMRGYRAALKQADSFIVINPDLVPTIVKPDTVDPIVDPSNFGRRIGWKITQVFPDPNKPSDKMTITDEYYDDRRVHTVEFANGKPITQKFSNPIGINPVIHIANQAQDGEEFGHPEAEALIDAFHRYGQVFEASIEGNILQGRPTPVLSFNTIQDLNTFWRRYGRKESVRSPDGTSKEVDTLSIDMSELMTISAAKFAYESPGSFADDTEKLLGLLFYLILQHVEIPEFALGNAIEGSKSSAETQMPVLEIFIRMRQKDCTPWMKQISKVVLAYKAFLVPGVTVEDVVMQWAKLTQNGRLILDSVKMALEADLLDERTALISLPLDIEKPEEVLRQAKKDSKKRKTLALRDQEATLKMTMENTPAPAGEPVSKTTREMEDSLREELENLDL